jgi:hypothetical protein
MRVQISRDNCGRAEVVEVVALEGDYVRGTVVSYLEGGEAALWGAPNSYGGARGVICVGESAVCVEGSDKMGVHVVRGGE